VVVVKLDARPIRGSRRTKNGYRDAWPGSAIKIMVDGQTSNWGHREARHRHDGVG
jgi:hypothetical protein